MFLAHPCDRRDKGGCSHKCLKTEEEEESASYKCLCPKGFLMEEDMKTCEFVHPCDRADKGGCQHICKRNEGKAICSYRKGFTLEEDARSCKPGEYLVDLKLIILVGSVIA